MAKGKNGQVLSFTQRVERLFANNEKVVFTQNTPSSKVVISNLGVYCHARNWLWNKSTIQFYPKHNIESVYYSKQGWVFPGLVIELNVKGRTEIFENKKETLSIKIRLKETHQEQANMLYIFCKNLATRHPIS